jgi:hypothetical protein
VRKIHHRDTEITQRAPELFSAEFFSVNLCVISVSLWWKYDSQTQIVMVRGHESRH